MAICFLNGSPIRDANEFNFGRMKLQIGLNLRLNTNLVSLKISELKITETHGASLAPTFEDQPKIFKTNLEKLKF